MNVTMAYTGMRWSEALGLLPGCLQGQQLRIDWKLYELDGRFYRGRPKDGSIRRVDVPFFLTELIAWHMRTCPPRSCTCRNSEPPWCPGERYVFLGARAGHFRRPNYSSRIVRPAADGWYPARPDPRTRHSSGQRSPVPVLADVTGPLPGRPLPPWPPVTPGEEFEPPQGKGVRRLTADGKHGRCPVCQRSGLLRMDGTLVRHKLGDAVCAGTGRPPQETAIASWLPVRRGLTPHGLRHGHRTWLDDLGVQETLKSERMGHEMPGIAGVYGTSCQSGGSACGLSCKSSGRPHSMNGCGSMHDRPCPSSTACWPRTGNGQCRSCPILAPETDIRREKPESAR